MATRLVECVAGYHGLLAREVGRGTKVEAAPLFCVVRGSGGSQQCVLNNTSNNSIFSTLMGRPKLHSNRRIHI